ncbi:MAG: DUF433 domain-containing protein [Pseudonocardiaceae bacterium]
MLPAVDAEPVPLSRDAHGVLRVGLSRVTLDVVVGAFREGATAEEIAHQYPTLDLADVYAVISYYLRHQGEVKLYLSRRHDEAEIVRRHNEARVDPSGIRDRLLARRNR